jgi:hypothetical protein
MRAARDSYRSCCCSRLRAARAPPALPSSATSGPTQRARAPWPTWSRPGTPSRRWMASSPWEVRWWASLMEGRGRGLSEHGQARPRPTSRRAAGCAACRSRRGARRRARPPALLSRRPAGPRPGPPDNNYYSGLITEAIANVDKYYGWAIYSTLAGHVGITDVTKNIFWPALGNHVRPGRKPRAGGRPWLAPYRLAPYTRPRGHPGPRARRARNNADA